MEMMLALQSCSDSTLRIWSSSQWSKFHCMPGILFRIELISVLSSDWVILVLKTRMSILRRERFKDQFKGGVKGFLIQAKGLMFHAFAVEVEFYELIERRVGKRPEDFCAKRHQFFVFDSVFQKLMHD